MDYSKLINASDEEDNITAFIAVYLGKFGNFGKKGSPLQFRNHPRLHEEKHQETENTEFHCYYFYIHGVYLYNRKLHQICLI